MNTQLSMPGINEDIMASSLRLQERLFEALIHDLESQTLSDWETTERIRLLERGLRRLSLAA